jgi:hypothetical protein
MTRRRPAPVGAPTRAHSDLTHQPGASFLVGTPLDPSLRGLDRVIAEFGSESAGGHRVMTEILPPSHADARDQAVLPGHVAYAPPARAPG